MRLIRAKVELDEADAAIVYRTDAMASEQVQMVPIPTDLNVLAQYPIGVIEGSENRQIANKWLSYLFSPHGQKVLARHGFMVNL